MQDYNINVNYNQTGGLKETDVKKSKSNIENKKTVPKTRDKVSVRGLQKMVAGGLAAASAINNYVGALTENTIQQKNRQTALTFAGFGVYSLSNPVTAGIAATLYTGNLAINYQIKKYKSDLSAGFMSALSGGVYSIGK